MTINERRYLKMLMNENRWDEASSWIEDKRSQSTSIYTQWLRDGEFFWIQDDNNRILEQRDSNHERPQIL